MNIYDYSIQDADGNGIPLKNYKGKVLLIVNTATACGFTPHYKELEQMYEKYHDNGLEMCRAINSENKPREQMPKSANSVRSIIIRNSGK